MQLMLLSINYLSRTHIHMHMHIHNYDLSLILLNNYAIVRSIEFVNK